MRKDFYICEICGKKAFSEKDLRLGNWIRVQGGTCKGIEVWLEKPREKGRSFMLSIGYQERDYDFCSIECLVSALKGKNSI